MPFAKGKVYISRLFHPLAVAVYLPKKQTDRGHKMFEYLHDTQEFAVLHAALCLCGGRRLEVTVAEYEAMIGRRT